MSMKMRTLALGTLAALAGAFSVQAQCGEANFGAAIGTGDDIVLPVRSLGFAFPFNGTTYTDVHVTTNGLLYLSNGGTPAPGGAGCCAGTSALLVAGSPKIAAYWSDLNMVAGTGSVRFNALPGKAVITWSEAVEFGNTVPFTFQMQLGIGGDITMTYDSRCQIRTAGDFLVGMSEGAAAAVPATSDFLAAGVSTTNTNFEVFTTLGSFDLTGQSVLFIPTVPGYAWITQPCPAATSTNFGVGCYDDPTGDSFYQLTSTNPVSAPALSNTAITMIRSGTGYTVVPVGTYVPPTPAATVLTLTDDSSTTTPLLTTPFAYPGGVAFNLVVCSNGSVWAGPGNSIAFTPAVTTMLNNPAAAWYSWHDYNPAAAGSGQVKFEQVGTVAYVTWDGVYNYGGTTAAAANTMQFQFDSLTGSVAIVYQTMSAAPHALAPAGEPHLVGWSPAGNSPDPGSITLATALPITVGGLRPMKVSANSKPISTPSSGSTVTYLTSDIPEFAPGAGVYIAINILSLSGIPAPGVDLGFLGAPGCAVFVGSLDFLQSMIGISSNNSVSLAIPAALPGGFQLFSQSAALIAPNSLPNGQNAFGLTTSDAISSSTGSW